MTLYSKKIHDLNEKKGWCAGEIEVFSMPSHKEVWKPLHKVFTNFNCLLQTFPGGLNEVCGCAAYFSNAQGLIQVSMVATVVYCNINCRREDKIKVYSGNE